VSDRLGEPQIYVMDVGGGEPRLVSEYAYGRRGYSHLARVVAHRHLDRLTTPASTAGCT
jgi:Tol biopolymer transport system component